MTGNHPSGSDRFLPVGLDVRGKSCLVVGGGSIGTRKVHNLVRAGADVTVVSPAVAESLLREIESGRVRWVTTSFRPEHLDGVFLVVATTDDESTNSSVVTAASERGILACDASSSARSQVIFGALHKGEDGVTIAVFTDGHDPAVARRTRDHIASLLSDNNLPED